MNPWTIESIITNAKAMAEGDYREIKGCYVLRLGKNDE